MVVSRVFSDRGVLDLTSGPRIGCIPLDKMARRALLVGCNYPGTKAALEGCVNDVFNMKALYEEHFGIKDFTILVDTDENYLKPTGRQIKDSLRELVEKTKSGDILVMHFSGHGTQVPSEDPTEEDMKDEALVPTDMNILLDDDLRAIVKDLPEDSFFTCVCDCCHSGGMLDHTEIQITGPKDKKAVPQFDTASVLAAFGPRAKGVPAEGVKNRSLQPDQLMSLLGVKTGKEPNAMNIRNVLQNVFGADASAKVTQYFTLATGMMSEENVPLNSAQTSELEAVKPGHKPPAEGQLQDDAGVLITGCQSHETSADACPGGDPANAYGALSNAIQTVVRAQRKKSKKEMSNKDLVFAVRNLLSESYYGQNPCLECSQGNADRAFITGNKL